MTDNDEFPDGPGVQPYEYVPLPDYGGFDYVRLPEAGRGFFSLEDGALLGALDWWLAGEIPDFPAPDWSSYDDHDPAVRKGIASKQKQILEMLVRSVETGHLGAQILERSFSDSRLLPDHTYVLFSDLIDCFEQHGHPPGDYLHAFLEDESKLLGQEADARAKRRAQFRYGINPAAQLSTDTPSFDTEAGWSAELRAKDLQIAQLQSQLTGGQIPHVRPLLNKEKSTLLAIIAVLCREAKLDPARHAKTANLLQDTAAKMGLNLSETTIENKLKEIPNALGSRMK